MACTNTGLVAHCLKALALPTKYMWGGIMRELTDNYINMLSGIAAYKSQYPPNRVAALKKLTKKGYYGCDCVGLIKSYYWGGIGTKANAPGYGKTGPDINAVVMYNNATRKGVISTLPEQPGLIVYCRTYPHVGVYIGNGEVIECTLGSRGDGVVRTKLSAFKWEHWFQCPYIVSDNTPPTTYTVTAIKTGVTAEQLPAIKNRFEAFGCTVDVTESK